MLIGFFEEVRRYRVPATIRELLDLIAALENKLAFASMDDFYYLSRLCLVKDEKHFDKFDRAFESYFKGIEALDDLFKELIPEDWLKSELQKYLSEEEKELYGNHYKNYILNKNNFLKPNGLISLPKI